MRQESFGIFSLVLIVAVVAVVGIIFTSATFEMPTQNFYGEATGTGTKSPIGTFDKVYNDRCTVAGWAKDPDTTEPIKVSIFKDGPYKQGTRIGIVLADMTRKGLRFDDKEHGFKYVIPESAGIYDGEEHEIWIYGLDKTGNPNKLLNKNPKTIRCEAKDLEEDNILVGAWFYDGWHGLSDDLTEECEVKTDHWALVAGITRREINYLYDNVQRKSLYEYEGITAHLPTTTTGTIPLYRMLKDGKYLYAAGDNDKEELLALGGTIDKIIGRIYTEKQPNTVQLHRPRFYTDKFDELTLDGLRARKISAGDATRMAKAKIGYVYAEPTADTTPLHRYVEYQPGQQQPREPLLGYAHSDDQAVMDQYIEWASDNSIDFFMFEWFWQPLPDCPKNLKKYKAMEDAFMASSSDKPLDFAVGWFPHENHYVYTEEFVQEAFDYMIKNYFNHPRYLTIDDKPVVYWASFKINNQLGGDQKVTEIIAEAEQKAINAGHDGIYFVEIGSTKPKATLDDMGFDGYTRFTFNKNLPTNQEFQPTSKDLLNEPVVITYQEMIDAYNLAWEEYKALVAQGNPDINFIPTVGTGYDRTPNPGMKYRSHIAIHNNPDIWEKHLTDSKNFVLNNNNGQQKIVMITAWNEWKGGMSLEPTKTWGTAYVEKVGEVFD